MPRHPRPIAAALMAALTLTTAWLAPGCGSEPVFDKAVDYTPDSLAQEVAFRTKALAPTARKAQKSRGGPSKKGAPLPGFVPEPETKTQSKTQTKKAEIVDIDGVLDDIEEKARGIKNMPTPEVFFKIADLVAADTTLDAGDRDTLVAKLKEMAAASQ